MTTKMPVGVIGSARAKRVDRPGFADVSDGKMRRQGIADATGKAFARPEFEVAAR